MDRSARSLSRRTEPLDVVERVLVGAELFLAIGALGGSIALLVGAIDFGPVTSELPFQSPVLAGIALGVFIGVLPLTAAVGALRRAPRAPMAHLGVGLTLMSWILIQVGFIGLNSWFQPFYFAFGGAITILALVNRQRRRAESASAPPQAGRHVGEDALDDVGVVVDPELVGHGE